MHQNPIIRQIVPGDETLVDDFFAAMGPESTAFFNRRRRNQDKVLDFCRLQDTDNRLYWMAEQDEQMVGLVFFKEWNTSIPWLGIAVREDRKGQGLGHTLIQYAQDYALRAGKGGIQLITHAANLRGQLLYESMGFERIGVHGKSGEWYYLFRYGA